MSGVDSAVQLPSTNEEEGLTALLNFRPSSRDVISGIAPHVFDDQRSSWRARSRRRRRTSSQERRRRSASPAPHRSPLRLSAVISVDEHGAIVDSKGDEDVVLAVYTAPPHAASLPSPPILKTASPVSSQSETQHNNKETKRRSFRIVLKMLVLRLK
ncbi:hypothetical protein MSAN_00835100 [Mycena sanguinolenta]|uniref:Uncharacterized protein n=1 Tax=Mycena sanguinolenta TaxID=230812 RepID=A0A8H6YV64_9AGAR|nr:hypothetical protein MSAN_00835100 [Mycena sanguinolenta]